MLLSPQSHNFANLVLKHFPPKKIEEHVEHHHQEPEKEEVVNNDQPMTNKEKYSLDYSKWYLSEESKIIRIK